MMDLFTWADSQQTVSKSGNVIDITDRLDARTHRYLDLLEMGYRPRLAGALLPFCPRPTDERKRA